MSYNEIKDNNLRLCVTSFGFVPQQPTGPQFHSWKQNKEQTKKIIREGAGASIRGMSHQVYVLLVSARKSIIWH